MLNRYKYNQRRYLFEQDNQDIDVPEKNVKTSGKPVARKASDSVDDQIDSLILMYEKEAVRDEVDAINEAIRSLSLKILLREQEEEAIEEPPEDTDAGGDTGADDTASDDTDTEDDDDPVGSEEMNAEPAEKENTPDLDIDQFTISVARLIMNKHVLLDIDKAIVNRTKNFLNDHYGDEYVKRFLDTLQEQFGLSNKEFDVNYSSIDAPFAIGANPSGAGSMGGG